jgi:Holliday junction resolvase
LTYRKGITAEQQLIRFLKDREYEANRTVGSRGAADIFAAKKGFLGLGGKKYVIQVKATTSDKVRVSKEGIKKLMKFADTHDSTAVLAVRFSRDSWRCWDNEKDSMLPLIFSALVDSKLEHLGSTKKDYVDLKVSDKSGRRLEKVF